jgi:hypothetical protein
VTFRRGIATSPEIRVENLWQHRRRLSTGAPPILTGNCHKPVPATPSIPGGFADQGHLPVIANMDSLFKLLVAAAFAALSCAALGQPVSKEQVKGLDEQVQDIKKDVLAISTELQVLEEKLLYPSNTQLSLFVSLKGNGKLRLDAVRLKLDGQDAAHHIYTFKELEALQGGGVQRLHTGNVRTGEHAIEVALIGKIGEADFHQVATHRFKKSVQPKLLEIVVDRSESAGKVIQFKE